MTLQTDQRLAQGRYRIRDHLGQGGMGTVYLAEDLNLAGRFVAIKENTDVSPEAQEQFKREAVMLASLMHTNLPRVTDHFIESSGRQYLVMDYIQGEDLRYILQEHGAPLPESVALDWIRQVIDALEYMHNWVDPTTRKRNPIIHRDIKPGNIKQAPDGRIVLVDFGLAKFVEGSVTIQGARAVTPSYSPVEQYTGGTNVRSDIYALGATLYALVTGFKPPEAPSIATGTTLPLPRKLNPKLTRTTERVILRAMQIQPAERYASVQEMRAALFNKRSTKRLTDKPFTPFVIGEQKGQPLPIRKSWFGVSFGIGALLLLILLVAGAGFVFLAPDLLGRLRDFRLMSTPTADALAAIIPIEGVGQVNTTVDTATPVITTTHASLVTAQPLSTEASNRSTPTPLPSAMPTVTSTPPIVRQDGQSLMTVTLPISETATNIPLPTATDTPVPTATTTRVATATQTPSPTQPATATATPPLSPTAIPTVSPTATVTLTLPPTATATMRATATPLPTATATNTPLPTATVTATPSATNTMTPRPTSTFTQSPPPTVNNTLIAEQTVHAEMVIMVASKRATLTAIALIPTATKVPSTPTVTATATPSFTPTNTATTTPKPTATFTPAATATPTIDFKAMTEAMVQAQATLIQQAVFATLTALAPTATNTTEPTAMPIPTLAATATPVPTLVPTATPIPPTKTIATVQATHTPLPTPTLKPTATAVQPPTATATSTSPPTNTRAPTNTVPPTPRPTATAALPVGGSVTLLEPLDSVLKGRRTFRWSTNVTLGENQYFELVFWPAAQEPMAASFGPVGSIKETAVVVDLDKTADSLSHLFQSGNDYGWGVLLVELNPYRRLQYLGGGHRFRFERSGNSGGSGSNGGGSGPRPTSTPRGD